MDCERFDKTTMELLYGELDELSEAAAMRHLHHCTRCRDIWGHLRTTREFAELPLEEPPEDLFSNILAAEENAHRSLPARERFSRAISVLAGYAMKPQLAMAALLLLMIGSSLIFVRTGPEDRDHVSVTEAGTPYSEPSLEPNRNQQKLVYRGEERPIADSSPSPASGSEKAKAEDVAASGDRQLRKTYSEAMSAFHSGRYAEAERLFSEVASGGGEQAASAALHEGHAARNGSGCQRASAIYDAVAARYSASTVADEASWLAASCYKAMGQLRRASAHYITLEKRPAFAERAGKALEELRVKEGLSAAVAEADPSTKEEQADSEPSDETVVAAKATAKPKPAAATAPPVTQKKTAPTPNPKSAPTAGVPSE